MRKETSSEHGHCQFVQALKQWKIVTLVWELNYIDRHDVGAEETEKMYTHSVPLRNNSMALPK